MTNNDRPSLIFNLQKSWNIWYHLLIILGRKGADPITSGCFYLELVLSVLLFGAETWVVNPQIGRLLGSFYHRVTRRLTGIQPWIRTYGIWY